MAYSDYGGYAYRNGKRVKDRSDVTITPKGDAYGTPGSYPEFAQMKWPSGHAVLGDGPVYLVLLKTFAILYKGFEKQDLPIDREDYDAKEVRRTIELDAYKVELVYTLEDNYYVYARLTQPDGNLWHGWSGFGVGAGLEDANCGFSTDDRESKLSTLWPESITG